MSILTDSHRYSDGLLGTRSPRPSLWRVACLWLAIGLLAATCVQASSEKSSDASIYPGYLSLKPVVVNLSSERKAKFLKIDIDLYVQTAEDAAMIEHHTPALRNELIRLLGGRAPDALQAPDAREQLRVEVLERLRETMNALIGRQAIGDLYFTGFILQ